MSISSCYAFGNFGDEVNVSCTPLQPYVGDCGLCHGVSFGDPTAAKDAYLAGGTNLTDFFCPSPSGPTCTDSDGDTFAVEGGDCGPVDCNDGDPAINPGAAENCSDGLDNDCDNLIDAEDGDAVGCPPLCTDNDGDTYAVEGGGCGPVDCDDTDATVNPGAAEICGDGLDNTCDGVVDEGCVVAPTCTDNDGDTYAVEGGGCGPVDCDDTDA
ncbi:MAG: putative metal-binding motif-containing protein, partial [Thermodesulfobacteriota bacterium]